MRLIATMMLLTLQHHGALLTHPIMVNDSVSLTRFLKPRQHFRSVYQNVMLTINESIHTGFLVTVKNDMQMNHKSCGLFNSLFMIYANDRNISFGCSQYLATYVNSPLHLSFMPSVFASLKEHIHVVVTAIRASCPPEHPVYRQCPNHPHFCIRRSLFCDGQDNCGVDADEADCSSDNDQIYISISDTRSSLERYGSFLLLISTAGLTVALLVTCVMWHSANRRRAFGRRYNSILSTSGRKRDSSEAEETVALLTFGLRAIMPQMAPKPEAKSNNFPYQGSSNLGYC